MGYVDRMIILLEPDCARRDEVVAAVVLTASRFDAITAKPYDFTGARHSFTEVHLLGSAAGVPTSVFEELPGVARVIRVSARYRLIGRHDARTETVGFSYNGVRFDEASVLVFAGLCAVDSPESSASRPVTG